MPSLVIIQARMESKRFPGKVLAPLFGQPMLLWELDRISAHWPKEHIVVASPESQKNSAIAELCLRHGYQCLLIPGDQNDVLHRYRVVAEHFGVSTVIRVTGDCPMFDGEVLCELEAFATEGGYGYVGTAREWPDGNDCEWMTISTLVQADIEAKLPSEREHVTPWVWSRPERFRLGVLPCPYDLHDIQWSVDSERDLRNIEALLKRYALYNGFGCTWKDLYVMMESNIRLKGEFMLRGRRNEAYLAQISQESGVEANDWDTLRY